MRAAQFAVSTGPLFGSAAQVSRYLGLLDGSGPFHQVQYNPPNLPLFKEGTRPFHGDYIDMTPAPMFLPDAGRRLDLQHRRKSVACLPRRLDGQPERQASQATATGPTTRLADSSQDPAFQSGTTCLPGQTSMRNQDVYMASLTRGLVVGSPSISSP